ncbi:MAG: dipeptidase PepV [Capsulimonadaceae bacterium]|nr:dipeptidase PepV [Capsulimonadaceae bacterium]
MTDFSTIDKQLDEWINARRDEIIVSAQDLIRIPSVLGPAAPGAPFGIEPLRALEYVRDLCDGHGLTTKIVDGYAMHAQLGDSGRLIGVLSHVDVVPAGEDWTYPPFGAVLADGKLYGRGALDDKGPGIASLYAMFAVQAAGVKLKSRIRAILGADEETGFRCVDYYFKHEEMPEIGFTPDGSFPAIYAEKGIATPVLRSRIPSTSDAIKLIEFSAGARSNMVPDRAVAKLTGNPALFSSVKTAAEAPVRAAVEGEALVVRAYGVSAHASYPHEGINAVGLLTEWLIGSGLVPGLQDWLTTLRSFAVDNTGAPLGIAGRDEIVGPLTSNLGVVATDGEELTATFSVRYPVTWKSEQIKASIARTVTGGFELVGLTDSPPLYVPKDDPLVKTLMEVYRAETGDDGPPKTMGGGTYARSLRKGVAFGPNFPGFPDVAHKADEFWYIDELITSTRIYAKALIRLAMA